MPLLTIPLLLHLYSCHRNVFTKSLSSNSHLFWLQYSGCQALCDIVSSLRLLMPCSLQAYCHFSLSKGACLWHLWSSSWMACQHHDGHDVCVCVRVCVSIYMYVCVCVKVQAKIDPALALWPSQFVVLPLLIYPFLSPMLWSKCRTLVMGHHGSCLVP
jgi:hypothetical protein